MQPIARVALSQKLETLTKVICTISILIAVALQNALTARDSMLVAAIGSLAFAATMFYGRRFPDQVLSLSLPFLYIMPALIYLLFHQTPVYNPLMAGLLGIFLSKSNFRQWHYPSEWKLPLVLWFLVIALSWPVIFLRETDFAPALTLSAELVNNNRLMTTAAAAGWVVNSAVTQGLGFLFADWLFATFKNSDQKRFRTCVIVSLGLSFLISSGISFYQAFFDIQFLNAPNWINLHQLTGGLMDANAFGVLAAMWGPGLVLIALTSQSRIRAHWIVPAMTLSWLSVLLSGSRSGLIIVGMCSFYLTWLGIKRILKRKDRLWLVTGSATIVAIAILLLLLVPTTIMTPIQRIRVSAEGSSPEIWNSLAGGRIPYGRIALQMIKEMPWTGVGLGSFNILIGGYSDRQGRTGLDALPPDNALNWYLNQLAELGLLGSIGWIMWISIFIRTLFIGGSKAGILGGILSCVLISFGIASLFGVHSERAEVLLTFWALVFWIATQSEHSAEKKNPGRFLQESSKAWIVILILSCTYAALHIHKGMNVLRVPFRAKQESFPYKYGFYPSESVHDARSFRWTQEKAVEVLPVNGPRLRVSTWVNHPDVTEKPVHLQVWTDQNLVVDTWFRDHRQRIHEIELPKNRSHTTITIRVNPVWYPADYGFRDSRKLGVAITEWEYLKE